MEAINNREDDLVTLKILKERLHRLEFLLHGSSGSSGIPSASPVAATREDTVSSRLASLESGLHRLASRHGAVQDVLSLYARYPDLFLPAADEQSPSTLDTSAITSIVFAHASSFLETVSRLTSIKDLAIPPTSASAELAALRPRLDQMERTQAAQVREISELRTRSARLLERWVEVGVVGQGEVWAEWEDRARAVEKSVRRMEVAGEEEAVASRATPLRDSCKIRSVRWLS